MKDSGAIDLPLRCSNCGKDISDGVRGRDWENYDGLMVACAECLAAANPKETPTATTYCPVCDGSHPMPYCGEETP